MIKQKVVSTSLGELTVSSLTLSDLRQLDQIFEQTKGAEKKLTSVLTLLPVIASSVRRVHQDVSIDDLEHGLTIEDFNALYTAVLEVSGMAKKETPAGEEIAPVPV